MAFKKAKMSRFERHENSAGDLEKIFIAVLVEDDEFEKPFYDEFWLEGDELAAYASLTENQKGVAFKKWLSGKIKESHPKKVEAEKKRKLKKSISGAELEAQYQVPTELTINDLENAE